MLDTKREYITVFGENIFECLQLILWGWVRNLKIIVISPNLPSRIMDILKRIFFIRKYIQGSIKEYKTGLGNYKGLWYEVNEEAIESTLRFYNRHLNYKNVLISYYNKILNTNKFEAYLKKQLSNQIFALLKELHLMRLSSIGQNEILIIKNPVNEFVIKYLEDKYKAEYRIRWVSSSFWLFGLWVYYGWLCKQLFFRGFTFNKDRKKYKISKEAAWGFYRPTLRDDILIDNERFKKSDLLMLSFNTKHPPREQAFAEAKRKGFDSAYVSKLKININRNIFNILFFYFLVPIKTYFQLLLSAQLYLFYYIFVFHKRAFPIEILMNLYFIKCNISTKDWGDIEETIILNKYGTKNTIFHWADLTGYKANSQALIAHNIYYRWGNIHHCHHLDNPFIDQKVDIGCIYKAEVNKAAKRKEQIISQIPSLESGQRIAVFFDTSFDNSIEYTESFFLKYLWLIKEFCKKYMNVNVMLKPKSLGSYEEKISKDNLEHFKELWDELIGCDNFICINPFKWSTEEINAILDVCVSMGLNSPSTIALICGKNGLYFDNTGNVYHPFAKKYKNRIVFEDSKLLFEQIDNILNGRFNCKDVISEREIREYDAFADDHALERMRESLYELTL